MEILFFFCSKDNSQKKSNFDISMKTEETVNEMHNYDQGNFV